MEIKNIEVKVRYKYGACNMFRDRGAVLDGDYKKRQKPLCFTQKELWKYQNNNHEKPTKQEFIKIKAWTGGRPVAPFTTDDRKNDFKRLTRPCYCFSYGLE